MTSPTQRTLAECRKRGWTAAVVEKWNPHAMIRQDLFGCIDIVALCQFPDYQYATLGIQACAGGDSAKRVKKAMEEPRLVQWLMCNNRFAVWSWRKAGPRGKRKLWTLRIVEIFFDSQGSLAVREKP